MFLRLFELITAAFLALLKNCDPGRVAVRAGIHRRLQGAAAASSAGREHILRVVLRWRGALAHATVLLEVGRARVRLDKALLEDLVERCSLVDE